MMRRAIAVAALGMLWARAARAQESLTLAGELPLARLLDACAARLGVVVEYQPKALTESVTLRGGVDDEQLWSLTNRLLAARGFTTIRVGDSPALNVVRVQDAQGTARIESSLNAADPVPAGYVRVLVPITNRDVASVLEAIRPLLTKPGGEAVAIGRERTILLSDLRSRVVEILEFVAALDAAPPEVEVARVELLHLDGQRMATLAMQVAAKREAASGVKTPGEVIAAGDARAVLIVSTRSSTAFWRALLASLDIAESEETRTYTPRHFGVEEVASLLDQTLVGGAGVADAPPRIVVDALTGSLIVTATPAAHDRVSALLERLDATPPGERRPMRTYPIRNRSVEDVLRVVGTLIEAGALESGSEEDASNAGAPSSDPPAEGMEGRALGTPALTITADEATSRLIAVGEPVLLDRLGRLIEELDIRQPQVEVEVLLVSLTEGQTFDMGVEMDGLIRAGAVSARLASLFGLSGGSTPPDRTLASPPGFSSLVLSPGEFSIVVRALETLNQGRSLSIPRLLVSNNQRATLDSTLEQPYTSVNAGDTIATTSFGGSSAAGTVVTVRPQISQADHLVLEYSVSLSTFVGESSDPSLPPPRQQNRVQSVATIPDGFAIAVGGIELTTQGEWDQA